MAKITIIPDNVVITTNDNETILDCGIRNKLNLPHSCKDGKCATCKCKLVDGDVTLDTYDKRALSNEELKAGYTLLCKARANNDVTINIPNLLDGFPIKIVPSKITNIDKIGNVAILTLTTPPSIKFEYYAGQYVDIMLQGKNRSYSIANDPHSSTNSIEIHVRYHPGGVFSEFVWDTLKLGDIMRFKGPLGAFRLQDSNRPIILICTGTGFAPIKAIMEFLYTNNSKRVITLYWGNRTLNDFYQLELLNKWASRLHLNIKLCFSQNDTDAQSAHHIKNYYFLGYVTESLCQDFIELSSHEVYACGNPKMIEDAFTVTTNNMRLPKTQFYSDAYTPAIS